MIAPTIGTTKKPMMPYSTAMARVEVFTPRSRIRRPGSVYRSTAREPATSRLTPKMAQATVPPSMSSEQHATEDQQEAGKDGHDDSDEPDDDEERWNDQADVVGEVLHVSRRCRRPSSAP